MASPQFCTSLGSDTGQTDRDNRQCVPLGALHLGGLHVYCNYMHKHARAPRESVWTVSQRSCGHSCQECPRRCTLTVEPKLPECSKGELKVITRFPFLVGLDCLTADCGNTHFEKDKDREVWQSTGPGAS